MEAKILLFSNIVRKNMVTEKAIHATQARAIADAYATQVDKDLKAKAPRISLDACNTRARAIPMPE